MNKKQLPLSGSEVIFSRLPWKTKGRRSNNCYAYAVNSYKEDRLRKSVPGNVSGLSSFPHTYTHCNDLKRRVISDNPKKVYSSNPNSRCKKGFYKIMMFVAPNGILGYGDFHFYKQHNKINYTVRKNDTQSSIAKKFGIPLYRVKKNSPLVRGKNIVLDVNVWSHKLGWATGPLLSDSCGKVIKDPRSACRKYSHNYKTYCNSFCVKNKGINVGKGNAKVYKNRF